MIVATGGMLRTLVVDWESPSNPGGVITTYMVTYDNTTKDTGDRYTVCTIRGLDVFTNYTISVTACTANGCGNQTDVVIGTTAEEGTYLDHTMFLYIYYSYSYCAVHLNFQKHDMLYVLIRSYAWL